MKRANAAALGILLVVIITASSFCFAEEWSPLLDDSELFTLYSLCIKQAYDYEICLKNTDGLCFMENESLCENLKGIIESVDFQKPDFLICLLPKSSFSLTERLERENESQCFAPTYVFESAFSAVELLSSKRRAEVMRKTSLFSVSEAVKNIEVSYNLLIYKDKPFEILVSTIAIEDSSIIMTSFLWLDAEKLQEPWSFSYEMAMRWGLETSFRTAVIDCQRSRAITYSGESSGTFPGVNGDSSR